MWSGVFSGSKHSNQQRVVDRKLAIMETVERNYLRWCKMYDLAGSANRQFHEMFDGLPVFLG